MLQKLKNFLKKYKLVILIVLVFFLILFLIVSALTSRDDEDAYVIDPITGERVPHFEERGPKYTQYQMDLSSTLLDSLDVYEGSKNQYEILDIDHKGWAESFAGALVGRNLEYSNFPMPAIEGSDLHYMDQTIHYWETQEDGVTYDVQSDLLTFSFSTPANLSGVSINPRNEADALKALNDISSKFFSSDFEYRVNDISAEGNYYRIDFSRLLDGHPIFLYSNELYLLVTPDGRLKEGRFLLAEFRESSRVNVMSSAQLEEQINEIEHDKSVVLRPIDESVYERYDRRFFIVDITGDEVANVNLEVGELVYYYTVKFQEEVIPEFLLDGSGDIEIEGEKIDVTFKVITEAIAS